MLKKITGSILSIMLMTTMFLGAFGIAAPEPVHAAAYTFSITVKGAGIKFVNVDGHTSGEDGTTGGTSSARTVTFETDTIPTKITKIRARKSSYSGTWAIWENISLNTSGTEQTLSKDGVTITYIATLTSNHTHTWNNNSYKASGNVITATCQGSGTCDLTKPTLTLNATGKTYDGSVVTASLTKSSTWSSQGLTTPTITYSPANSKNVGTYTASAKVGNATATKQFTITPKEVGLTWGTNTFTYDGQPHVPTATATNLVSGDSCTVSVDGAQTAAGDSYTATAASLSNSNYKLPSSNTKAFTISKKQLTLTGVTANDKVYDGTDAADLNTEGAALEGVVNGDNVQIDTITGVYTGGKSAGEDKAVQVTATLKGEAAGNYEVKPLALTADITKKPVTVTGGITAEDKVYDGTTDATVDASKAEFDDVISGDKLTITATGKFSTPDVGTGKTVHLTLGALGGDDAGNYMLHHAHGEVTTTASITPKQMTVTADGYEDKYDGDPHRINVEVTDPADGYTVTYKGPKDTEYSSTNPGFTDPGEYVVSYKVAANNYETAIGTATVKIIGKNFEGIVGNDYDDVYDKAAHGITVTVPDEYKSYKVTYSTSEDGTYSEDPIKYTNFTDGAKTVYYKVSKTGYNDFTGRNTVNITKKAVTVSGITAKDKPYDGKTTAELVTKNASFAGIMSGDELIVSTTGTFEDKTAEENKTVTFGTLKLGGKDANNYELSASGNQESTTATISKKEITVNGITSLGKRYDGNKDATSTLYYEDEHLVGKIEGDKLDLEATGEFEDPNEGKDKTINITGMTLTGDDKDNYVLAKAGQQKTTKGDISKKTLKITAEKKTKVYGVSDPEFTYEVEGLVAGDSLTGSLSRQEGENVGEHTITLGSLHAGGNYNIDYTHGILTITKATTNSVTVSIDGWTYGDDPNTPKATAAHGVNTAEFTYSKTEDGGYTGTVPTDAGSYYVKATVADTANYAGAVSEPVGFTIAKKVVGLDWSETEFTYDGTAHKPKAAATGLVGKDKCTVTVEGEQTDANAKTGTDNYTATAATLSNDNYKLPDNKTTTFTIAQKEITVSGIKAKDKVYDGKKDADLIFSDAVLDGKVGDDDVSVTATGTFDNKNAGTRKTVTISGLTLTGDLKDNYVLASKGQQKDTTADIEKKDIAVDAEPKHKAFGEKDPELTYDADDLVEGDKFTGKLEREEGEDAGRYEIKQGTLTAGDNYTIIYDPADFTIRQADNSVTAEIEGWTYGDDPNAPSATADFGQDKAAFTYSDKEDGDYTGTVPTDAGKYYVKATIAETNNYKGAVSDPVEFTIAKKEVGLDWSGTELTYNGKAQKPKATATGLVGKDECTVTVEGEQTDANAKSGKDYYEAEAKALSNDNYKLPEKVKTKFTIAPKELTQSMISLDSDTFKHDGSKKGPEVTMTDEGITEGDQPKQMAKDEDYTLSGDVSSSELGTYVITAEGKGNYTGSIETSWMMYSKKSNEQKEEGTGGRGDFEVFVDIENNSSTLTVDNLTIDLAKRFLTEEDMARYTEGEDVLVYMIVKEQPKSETGAGDRYILGQLFREEGATDIDWYEITVWKKIGKSAAVQVHDTVEELSMSVEVPDGQKNAPEGYTREFYLGRSHDGVAKLLAQTSKVKVGFGSSKFSTYALAYKDTKNPVDPDDPGKGGNGGSGKGGSSKGGTNTGDPNDLAGLIALMLASGGALGAMGCRRRRSSGR